MKWGIRVVLMLVLCSGSYFSFPQSRLSPKFTHANGRVGDKVMLLSVAVYDTGKFMAIYKDNINILHYYEHAKIFSLQASRELVLENFSIDSNILFVDILNDAVAEGGSDNFNNA